MTKRPKQLTVETMQDAIGVKELFLDDNLFMNSEVGILHGSPDIFHRLLMQDTPFAISDHRMGLVERGEIHAMFDLVERRLTAGTVAFIGPGTIVQPLHVSKDLIIKGIVLFPSFSLPFATGHLPTAFNGQTTNFQIKVTGKDFNINIVAYGTPKQTLGEGILFDDEEPNRIAWNGTAYDVDNIIEVLKAL